MHIIRRKAPGEWILHQRYADPVKVLHDQKVWTGDEFLMQ